MRFIWWRATSLITDDRIMINDYTPDIFNCCFEPAYTIEHIVGAMKKVTGLTQFVPDIPNWVIMPATTVIGALGTPMGICPAPCEETADFYKYLWKEVGWMWI